MSGKIFHTDLLRSLNSVGKDAEFTTDDRSTIKLPDSAPVLPPPIEDICKLPLTIPFVLKTLWNEYGPTTFRPALARWAPIASPYKTQVRAFTVEAEPLERILFACRQHKTTLTGLLHALTLTSLASQLTEEAAPALASGTTIDMRRYIEPNLPAYPGFKPERTMANFVTLMTHEFERGLVSQIRSLLSRPAVEGTDKSAALSPGLVDLIWSAAARVRREIEGRVEAGLKNDLVGVMKFVGDWQQEMAKTASRPRQHSWWVSGTGVLDGSLPKSSSSSDNAPSPPPASGDDDAWTIRRAQFALSTETTAAAINISPLTVAGERLCVGGSWQDCLFDVSLGERVMADLESWLGQIA
ncbi:Alcohol acetyltransferase [Cytospora paraplurivora]|uniref:Alcohol acetyltransferase n=1 Tax=Cytospora paraplurivora TaxID=2898453 RepID=A0AAN9TYU0_9PEZI